MKKIAAFLVGVSLIVVPDALIPLNAQTPTQLQSSLIAQVPRGSYRRQRCVLRQVRVPRRYYRGRYIPSRVVTRRVCYR